MIEIPLTKGQVTSADDIDADLAEIKWHAIFSPLYADGGAYRAYHSIRLAGGKKTGVYLHRIILARILGRELLKGEEADHIDTNTLNNCRYNLRLATRSQNTTNQRLKSINTSGYRGVSLHKQTGRWRATIGHNKRVRHLGLFDTPEQAYAAYCVAARELHGEFARLETQL